MHVYGVDKCRSLDQHSPDAALPALQEVFQPLSPLGLRHPAPSPSCSLPSPPCQYLPLRWVLVAVYPQILTPSLLFNFISPQRACRPSIMRQGLGPQGCVLGLVAAICPPCWCHLPVTPASPVVSCCFSCRAGRRQIIRAAGPGLMNFLKESCSSPDRGVRGLMNMGRQNGWLGTSDQVRILVGSLVAKTRKVWQKWLFI